MLKEVYNAYAEAHAIEITIERLKRELLNQPVDSPRAVYIRESLKELVALRDLEKEPKKQCSLDLKTIFNAGVSLVGMAMILGYEKEDIITSKALSIATRLLGK